VRDRGLPDRREFEYRIKSASEEHERVVLESELSIAVTVPSRPVPWPLVAPITVTRRRTRSAARNLGPR
jgi:hypothetical protein